MASSPKAELLWVVLGCRSVITMVLFFFNDLFERRKEIGIRRALGAKRGDIQLQFLIESLVLSLLGGVFGMGLGLGVAYGACQYGNWEFFVSTMALLLGVGVSSGVGLFFGFYPARQAARLDPITALRSG